MQSERKRALFWVCLFVITATILAIPYFVVKEPPLLDYADHLARTFVLSHLHDPAYNFSQHYRADWKPYPYILWDIFMIPLQHVVPVELAGKIMLITCTILLPVSVAWFLWQANRTEMRLSLVACALAYYATFLWGFTAYHLSMGLCFLMVGTWLWYRRKPSFAKGMLFLLLCFASYFAHLLGFASAAFILVIYELTQFNWRESLRLYCFLFLPSLLALWARPGLSQDHMKEWRPLPEKYHSFLAMITHGYNLRLDSYFGYGLLLCLLIAIVWNRELRVNWRWMVTTLGMVGVFVALPFHWGLSYDIDLRLVPPICLLLLSVFRVGRRANWIAVLAIALTLLRVFNISEGFKRQSIKSAAMNRGIERIERNSRILAVVDEDFDADVYDRFYTHYYAYNVIRRGASARLFDIAGQNEIRIISPPLQINPDLSDPDLDWFYIRDNFEYIWCYGHLFDQSRIPYIADKVYHEGELNIYRIKKSHL